MRFKRYPRWELYEVTPRKLAAARRAVQKEKDPFFLIDHQHQITRINRLAITAEGIATSLY